eukprot:5959804-Karenia_brevis.AAC.1
MGLMCWAALISLASQLSGNPGRCFASPTISGNEDKFQGWSRKDGRSELPNVKNDCSFLIGRGRS